MYKRVALTGTCINKIMYCFEVAFSRESLVTATRSAHDHHSRQTANMNLPKELAAKGLIYGTVWLHVGHGCCVLAAGFSPSLVHVLHDVA